MLFDWFKSKELCYEEVFRKLQKKKFYKDYAEKLSKIDFQKGSEYPPQEFKNLSAEEILRWLEQANKFIRKFLSADEILRQRELKNIDNSLKRCNIRSGN